MPQNRLIQSADRYSTDPFSSTNEAVALPITFCGHLLMQGESVIRLGDRVFQSQGLLLRREGCNTQIKIPPRHCDREILSKYHVLLLITGKKKIHISLLKMQEETVLFSLLLSENSS